MSQRTLSASRRSLGINRGAGRTVVAALALVVAGVLALFGLSLRGQATGTPVGQSALDALLGRSPNAVVFSEFGVDHDTFWAASPCNPADRVQLGVAPHEASFSVFPSLSPGGAHIAYTAVVGGSFWDGTSAQLWLLDTATGASRVLANDVDLRSVPIWSPAGDAVVVRQNDVAGGGQLLRVALDGSSSSLAQSAAGLYSVGFVPDGGSFYYATLSASGADLLRAPMSSAGAAGAPQVVAHLSEGLARDWHISPDGTRLAYLAQSAEGGYSLRVLNLASGAAGTALSPQDGAVFNPIWEPDGALTAGSLSQRSVVRLAPGGSAAGSALPAPTSGFDVPVSWSPDGLTLIVRAFAGDSTADPGPSRLVAIDATGARHQLSPESDLEVAGWLTAAAANR